MDLDTHSYDLVPEVFGIQTGQLENAARQRAVYAYTSLVLVIDRLAGCVVDPAVLLAEVGVGASMVVVMGALPDELGGVFAIVYGPVAWRARRGLRVDEGMYRVQVA